MVTPRRILTCYSFLLALLLISLSASVLRQVAGDDDDDDDDKEHPLKNLGGLRCMHKLAPCKPFLEDELKKPELCCDPLKELLDDNKDCFCAIYYNDRLQDNLDIKQDQLSDLPKQCGLDDKPDDFCKGWDKSSASRVSLSSANYGAMASFLMGAVLLQN